MKEDQQYFDEMWKINPGKYKEDIFDTVTRIIKERGVPMKEVSLKYKEYFHWWNTVYGKREAKFIGKDNRLLSVYEFVNQEMYLKSFTNPNKLREEYLFGYMSYEEFKEKHRDFKSQFRQNTSTGN